MVPNNKNKGRLLQQSMFLSLYEGFLIQRKWWKKSFPYETKARILCIPMWKTCLWCLIRKGKEIIMRIQAYPI